MSQVTEHSVRFQTALASIKLIQASADLDLTEDDFDFLTSNKDWIATDRSRARRCVEPRPDCRPYCRHLRHVSNRRSLPHTFCPTRSNTAWRPAPSGRPDAQRRP